MGQRQIGTVERIKHDCRIPDREDVGDECVLSATGAESSRLGIRRRGQRRAEGGAGNGCGKVPAVAVEANVG